MIELKEYYHLLMIVQAINIIIKYNLHFLNASNTIYFFLNYKKALFLHQYLFFQILKALYFLEIFQHNLQNHLI